MAIEDLLGGIIQLPLGYGNMTNNMYSPMYGYGQSQGNNMAQLGGQSMGLYGNLAGQQASMYQSELPFQMEQAKWNSIAPVLGGLLGQFGLGGGNIGGINMSFNRPNVMAGYQGAVNNAYSNARGYDGWMNDNFNQQRDSMPQLPTQKGGGPVNDTGFAPGAGPMPTPQRPRVPQQAPGMGSGRSYGMGPGRMY